MCSVGAAPAIRDVLREEDDAPVPKRMRLNTITRWDAKPGDGSSLLSSMQQRMQDVRDAYATAQRPFRCPICLDTLGDIVVECAECAHVFCDPCLRESLKRNEKCPLCRCKPTPLRRNKPIERLVAALPETCPFLENGCWASLTRATASHHALTCGFARFTCPHCHLVFLRNAHDETLCSALVVACPLAHLGCSFRARLVDMDDHLKERVHFDLAMRLLQDESPPASSSPSSTSSPSSELSKQALSALLEMATTAWNEKDEATNLARVEFVQAMETRAPLPP
ncbi:hypothetical protein AC1031_010640 [Aphanomyces cochlioides]|nr:hypothetical protein AC1031_010640 [Aphanomyces cochlioides]